MYYKEVDKRYREAMTAFLKKHFRYHTMNSWNRSTSYANNIKLYNLNFSKTPLDKILIPNLDFVFIDATKKEYLWERKILR